MQRISPKKNLFDWPDVFADIWNFIAFDGKSVIQPIDLLATKARTQFKADGKLHEQERNVAKIWMTGKYDSLCSLLKIKLLWMRTCFCVLSATMARTTKNKSMRIILVSTAKKYIPFFSVERVCALAKRPSLHTGVAVFFYARKM